MTAKYEIEIGENSEASTCHCCSQNSYNGHGFVYKNSDAHAVYYAAWSKEHAEKMVTFAFAIGEWDDDSTVDSRVCFGIEAYEAENDILLRVIEPNESPWPSTDLLGQMLSRSEGLQHSLIKEVFVIIEEVLHSHVAIQQYLSMQNA